MNITTTLDGEQVTILNITGDERQQSIVYIDSQKNIKVKNTPLDWSRQSTFATSAQFNYPREWGTFNSKALLQSTITSAKNPSIGDIAYVVESPYETRRYLWTRSQFDGSYLWAWDVLINGGIIYHGSFGTVAGAYKSALKTSTLQDIGLPSASNVNSMSRRNPVIPREWYYLGTPLRFELIGGIPIDSTGEVCGFKIFFGGTGGTAIVTCPIYGGDIVLQTSGWAPSSATDIPIPVNMRAIVHAVSNPSASTVGHWTHGEVIAGVPSVGVDGVTVQKATTVTRISDNGNSNKAFPATDVDVSLWGTSIYIGGSRRWYIDTFRIIAG